MNILALDTSARSMSAAVIENKEGKARVVAMVGVAAQRGSSERILALVEEVLAQASTRVEELEAIAVCRGPGSLTGLRVGIGTARGIATGAGRPLIGISSLRAIAAGLGPGPPVLALVEAGRGEIYGCLYAPGEPPRPLGPERVGRPEAFAEAVGGRKVRVAGPGASRYRELVGVNGSSQMASEELLAGLVGLLAWGHLSASRLTSGHLAPSAGDPAGPRLEDLEETSASPRYLRREQGPVRFEE